MNNKMENEEEKLGHGGVRVLIMEEDICLSGFDQVEENENWFNNNFQYFEKNYKNKFVAVIKPDEYILDDDLEKLITQVENKYDPSTVFISVVPTKAIAAIL